MTKQKLKQILDLIPEDCRNSIKEILETKVIEKVIPVPRKGQLYSFTYHDGDRGECIYEGDGADLENQESRNIFLSKTLERKVAEKQKYLRELEIIADIVNEGWEPDWSFGGKKKYYIYTATDKFYVTSWLSCNGLGNIYFKSKRAAQEAIDRLTDEAKDYFLERG